jgi:hypothetical protein
LDKQTIRTLTYMATVERLKPDYSIVVQNMESQVDDYILEIRSQSDRTTLKKSPTEITKDKNMVAKFNPIEANRIGYMAGVCETIKENKLVKKLR